MAVLLGKFLPKRLWTTGVVLCLLGSAAQCGEIADITQTTTTNIVVDTPIAPPSPQQDIITPEPSPESVWVPGYWNRDPDKWSWVAGHWEKPPFGNARFVAGYWKYDQAKYEWQPGHWAPATTGVVVAKPIAPPPTFYEPIPQPTEVIANQVWVPGQWDWNGITWVWLPGYYAVPPAPRVQWIPGYWRQGLLGAYRWTPGHWAPLP